MGQHKPNPPRQQRGNALRRAGVVRGGRRADAGARARPGLRCARAPQAGDGFGAETMQPAMRPCGLAGVWGLVAGGSRVKRQSDAPLRRGYHGPSRLPGFPASRQPGSVRAQQSAQSDHGGCCPAPGPLAGWQRQGWPRQSGQRHDWRLPRRWLASWFHHSIEPGRKRWDDD